MALTALHQLVNHCFHTHFTELVLTSGASLTCERLKNFFSLNKIPVFISESDSNTGQEAQY